MVARSVTDADPLYDRAVSLLRALSGPLGIGASTSTAANYSAVFARDAVMAGIAGLLIDDAEIEAGLARTLEHLRDTQGPEGQIASNYHQLRVSFGTLAPRIDSVTWYIVGVALSARAAAHDAREFRGSVRAAVRLLDALEYNGRHLVYVPPGGNWADEYPYEGYILYDQVLRAWALKLAGALYDEDAWLAKAEAIEETVEKRYWPDDADRTHPLAAFSPTVTRDIFDLAACSLLGVSGIAPRLTSAALDGIARRFLDHSRLPPAFDPVIDESHPDWPALRRYHLHEFRNRPHEYHNGGVWPIWLGWLALGFARAHRMTDVDRLRRLVDPKLGVASFEFHEYLHGVTGTPGGMSGMAYSASGVVFLRVAGSDAVRELIG